MASAITGWATPGTYTDLLTSGLDSLASGSGSALGTEFNNASGLYVFGDFVLSCTLGGAPTANTVVDLYLIPATDGSNYNEGSSTVRPPNFYVGSFLMTGATTVLLTITGVPLPPCKFKLTVLNSTGQSMGASGNKVSILPYKYQSETA